MHLLVLKSHGAAGRYTALSYCWGEDTDTFTTRRENLCDMMEEIPLDDPTAFLDAFEISRRLNIRYIWIDAHVLSRTIVTTGPQKPARWAPCISPPTSPSQQPALRKYRSHFYQRMTTNVRYILTCHASLTNLRLVHSPSLSAVTQTRKPTSKMLA